MFLAADKLWPNIKPVFAPHNVIIAVSILFKRKPDVLQNDPWPSITRLYSARPGRDGGPLAQCQSWRAAIMLASVRWLHVNQCGGPLDARQHALSSILVAAGRFPGVSVVVLP
jgi:hypothetical protein